MKTLILALALSISGQVVSVHDGDTVTVQDKAGNKESVRLQAVDAPELTQLHGDKSKAALSKYVLGKRVKIESHGRDRYGRLIGTVHRFGDINLKMVKSGAAWWYQEYAPKEERYRKAQEAAKAKHLGLWADGAPQPPWDYRKEQKLLKSLNASISSKE